MRKEQRMELLPGAENTNSEMNLTDQSSAVEVEDTYKAMEEFEEKVAPKPKTLRSGIIPAQKF